MCLTNTSCVVLLPLDKSSGGWITKSSLLMLFQFNISLQNFTPPISHSAMLGKKLNIKCLDLKSQFRALLYQDISCY
uniref:Putative ovule protein n=1 Tax=Solanum chacoense TaxID=4108 RepID=A0A0V0I643_SOLCH